MISTALALLEPDEQRNVLSEFYQKYKNRFYAIAYSKLHGKAAAEDAVQEAFLRIVDKPENFYKIELSVALYHRNEDMFAIPLQIAELNRKYKFYMRHHPYIPDWDTNLYCI